MKKINNKGIGHHLLLMVVAVVAVIGAAGYFVWQRQQDNDIDAKAATWNQGPGTDTPIVKKKGAILDVYGYEHNPITLAKTASPYKRGSTQDANYDYKTGDIIYIKRNYDSTGNMNYQIIRAYRSGAPSKVLRTFLGKTSDGYDRELNLCVGADYVAYLDRLSKIGSIVSNVYAATKDFTQVRTVLTDSETKPLIAERAIGGITALSCGDQYFYTIRDRKVFKSPYNNLRTKLVGTKLTTVTIPDYTAVYDLPDSNYVFCGNQYQSDAKLVVHHAVIIRGQGGLTIVDLNKKTTRFIPESALDKTYWFCSLSPDGTAIAHGDKVSVYNLITNTLKSLDTSGASPLVENWRPVL